MPPLELRLREPTPGLLGLPWPEPLAAWDVTRVPFRDVPVGPSRHLVRFVEADGRLWALKALPRRVAAHEYDVLREMEGRGLPAVRAAGVVLQPTPDDAVLVTHYLERSWQYRRLLMRVPWTMTAHRARLFDGIAALLADLHRSGIYWGDCSLANTLFMRDGQAIQAWMVDAETAEFHPSLSDGQRRMDLDITVENIAGGLLDVAARRGEPPEAMADVLDQARSVAERYDRLWGLLRDEPVVDLGDQHGIESRVRRLNDGGFAVDEVRLEPADGDGRLRVKVAVAARSFHADQLRRLTGLDVGEGQATILLADLHGYRAVLEARLGRPVPEREGALRWVHDVFTPGAEQAHRALGGHGGAVQAYCDLLEVRWLLSEQTGHDVGDAPALAALAHRDPPGGSAAGIAFVDLDTQEVEAVHPPDADPR